MQLRVESAASDHVGILECHRTGSCSSRDDGGDVTKAFTRTLVASSDKYFRICLMEYRPFCKLCSHECSWRDSLVSNHAQRLRALEIGLISESE